ncbi:MAG: XRE family transcriptional regulator [Candidimonas sp.]|nr:MAG: XRE family transcriptional regulator [Candidimonas sp.]TAM24906.1 MAG: XRE family transcriptional regulator [Candidimonas sp.]
MTDTYQHLPLFQEQPALINGIARSYVSRMERGQRNISLLNILRLAKALNLPPVALLGPPEQKE